VRAFTYHHGPLVGDTDAKSAGNVAFHLGFRHEVVEAFRGDITKVIAANSLGREGMANFCSEVDAWTTLAPTLSASDQNVLFVSEIPGMAVAPRGGTPESVLTSVGIDPIDTIEYFLQFLDSATSSALRAGWAARYEHLLKQAASYADPREGHDRLYLEQRLPNTHMQWRERFQMPHVRVANPFLDNDVVDFVRALPIELRANKVLHREAVAEAFPDLLRIPIAAGGWNPPDWASELRDNAAAIMELIQAPSRLDELIPPEAIIRLMETGLAAKTARRDDMNQRLRTLVKRSAPVRRLVRAAKPKVKPAVRGSRSWARLMLDLLSLRSFLSKQR
jgi:hypothetical protein